MRSVLNFQRLGNVPVASLWVFSEVVDTILTLESKYSINFELKLITFSGQHKNLK